MLLAGVPGVPGVGFNIVSFSAGLVAGWLAAKLLHDWQPLAAWVGGVVVLAGFYALSKNVARRPAADIRLSALLAVLGLAVTWWMMLAVGSYPRRPIDPLPALIAAIGLIICLIGAVLLPLAILLLACRRTGERVLLFTGASTPIFVTAGLWALVLAVNLTALSAALVLAPAGWWGVLPIVGVLLALPAVSWPVWGTLYVKVLAAWRAKEHPVALRAALQDLRARIDFHFDSVLCLEHQFGGGRVCEVVSGLKGSTFVVSESIPTLLGASQFFALLAHEAAHVRLRHTTRRLVAGTVALAVAIVVAGAAGILVSMARTSSIGFLAPLIVALVLVNLRGLYIARVTRRHEFEADEFAANIAGADALLGALEALQFTEPRSTMVHSRWTTHGTWERRSARLRELRGLSKS